MIDLLEAISFTGIFFIHCAIGVVVCIMILGFRHRPQKPHKPITPITKPMTPTDLALREVNMRLVNDNISANEYMVIKEVLET
jgi:hypothetical protein